MSLALCWLPPEDLALDPVPPFRSVEGRRTREALLAVVEQFQVDTAPRYVRRDITGDHKPETFCNFFAHDVALAMGCAWPRMLANELHDWFPAKGAREGWVPVSPVTALGLVEAGHLVVPVHQALGHGHVAVCVPQPMVGGNVLSLRTAQAGVVNFVNRPIIESFPRGLVFKLYAHP